MNKMREVLARKHRKENRCGAAAMEFALVLPILLLIMGGIADYARAFLSLQMMANGASEGARMAIISTDPTVNDDTVIARVKSFFPNDEGVEVVVDPPLPVPAGEIVSVTVSQPFNQIFLGFFNVFAEGLSPLPDTLTYTASGRRQ